MRSVRAVNTYQIFMMCQILLCTAVLLLDVNSYYTMFIVIVHYYEQVMHVNHLSQCWTLRSKYLRKLIIINCVH